MAITELPTYDNTISFETLTVSSSVKVLTSTKYQNAGNGSFKDARAALITNGGAPGITDIRFTTDGTAPVALTTGHKLLGGDSLILKGYGNIANFKAIADNGDAIIQVSYYR